MSAGGPPWRARDVHLEGNVYVEGKVCVKGNVCVCGWWVYVDQGLGCRELAVEGGQVKGCPLIESIHGSCIGAGSVTRRNRLYQTLQVKATPAAKRETSFPSAWHWGRRRQA